MRNFSRESNILLGNLYYDIAPAVQKLLNKFNFYVYEGPLSISPLESSLKLKTGKAGYGSLKINGGGLFKNISATGDLLIDEILNQRIENYAKKYIPFLWKGLDYLEELDRRINFRGYIHHAGAYDSFFGLPVYYFRRENKPVIIIQHGAYGFALNRITEYSDFGHDGYFFGWGSGVGSMYEDRKKGSCRIMSTGSSLLDVIRKNRVPQKTISRVCYVPCGPRAYTAYYPNGQPCLDSELFIMEINFLSALKPYLKRYDITYKVAPQAAEVSPLFGESPMPRWVKENLPGIKIELRPLSSVMNEFDLFIIDWPTTTLLQACATGAEVIVYTGNNYHTPTDEAVELLRQRAIVALKHGDFIDKIREVLDKGVVISDVEDTAFLERYGIYKNDGKSLERITAGIEDVFKKP